MKRWRRKPNETGLARHCQGPRGFELRENGKVLVRVGGWRAPARGGNGRWHWYGFSRNSLCESLPRDFATAEEAKADALVSLSAELAALRGAP